VHRLRLKRVVVRQRSEWIPPRRSRLDSRSSGVCKPSGWPIRCSSALHDHS
jgi:hypothetical protein